MTPYHHKNTQLLFAMNCGKRRDTWLLEVLRKSKYYVLSPKQDTCTSPSRAQVTLWRKGWKEWMMEKG